MAPGNADTHDCQTLDETSPTLAYCLHALTSCTHSLWCLWSLRPCQWRTGTRSSWMLQNQDWGSPHTVSPADELSPGMSWSWSRVGSSTLCPIKIGFNQTLSAEADLLPLTRIICSDWEHSRHGRHRWSSQWQRRSRRQGSIFGSSGQHSDRGRSSGGLGCRYTSCQCNICILLFTLFKRIWHKLLYFWNIKQTCSRDNGGTCRAHAGHNWGTPCTWDYSSVTLIWW